MSIRYIDRVVQGVDEEIIYSITTTNWGSSPSAVAVVVKNEATGADVTTGVTTGSSSVSGDVITLPTIDSLIADTVYRVEVKFTTGSNVLECYFLIEAET